MISRKEDDIYKPFNFYIIILLFIVINMKKYEINFITSNDNKFNELKDLIISLNYNIRLVQKKEIYYEPQNESIENIACLSSKYLSKKLN